MLKLHIDQYLPQTSSNRPVLKSIPVNQHCRDFWPLKAHFPFADCARKPVDVATPRLLIKRFPILLISGCILTSGSPWQQTVFNLLILEIKGKTAPIETTLALTS